MHDFWLVRVFYKDGISGNLTGVFLSDTPPAPGDLQATATRLNLPDTAFAWPGPDGILIHRSYSPREELAFCTQTLLATAAVQAAVRGTATGSFQYETRVGRVTVCSQQEGLWWLDATPDPARFFAAAADVLAHLGMDERGLAGPVAVAGIGRRRLYVPLASTDDLYSLMVPRATVLEICAGYRLSGICLFVVVSPERIALRVFTTSLDGAEDAATGGAALGLLGYDRYHPLDVEDVVSIEQGHMDSPQRGYLLVQKPRQGSKARLGGYVDVLVKGILEVLPGQGNQ